MLQLKEGVLIRGTRYINAILEAVQSVYEPKGWVTVPTAGEDGKHLPNSYHYKDRALDIRFWDVPVDQRELIAQAIRDRLPKYYDVVIEGDHYHIEADEQKELHAR